MFVGWAVNAPGAPVRRQGWSGFNLNAPSEAFGNVAGYLFVSALFLVAEGDAITLGETGRPITSGAKCFDWAPGSKLAIRAAAIPNRMPLRKLAASHRVCRSPKDVSVRRSTRKRPHGYFKGFSTHARLRSGVQNGRCSILSSWRWNRLPQSSHFRNHESQWRTAPRRPQRQE